MSEKKGRSKLWSGLGVMLLLFCCGMTALGALLSQGTESESNNDVSVRTNSTREPTAEPTPQPIAPSIEEIFEAVDGMTDAQRNNHNRQLKGNLVEGWMGEVVDVNAPELDFLENTSTIYVDMIDDNIGAEVHIVDIDEETALEIGLGSTIIFSGTIKTVTDVFGTVVTIDKARVCPPDC